MDFRDQKRRKLHERKNRIGTLPRRKQLLEDLSKRRQPKLRKRKGSLRYLSQAINAPLFRKHFLAGEQSELRRNRTTPNQRPHNPSQKEGLKKE